MLTKFSVEQSGFVFYNGIDFRVALLSHLQNRGSVIKKVEGDKSFIFLTVNINGLMDSSNWIAWD
ncbi:MAG: hypothetical protein KME47_10155 [Nodosilinea sp. WJT8-NPBG4]|jgi:hypothetical protein|nr:hypothetical protein [Nodosilinea sp. WJT8-NPBG4]